MRLIFAAVAIFLFSAICAEECPDITFVKDFQPKRFKGKWRAIETTGIDMACGAYEVFETDEPDAYRVHILPINIDTKIKLNRPNDFSAGFTEESPLELMNKASLNVFETDYENYAVAVECKNSDGLFFVSATIASRTGKLSDYVIERIKQRLASRGVDISGFKPIRQDIC